MARPDRAFEVKTFLSELAGRVARLERREAFANKAAWVAQAGGLAAPPVALVDLDARGNFAVSSSTFADAAAFVAAPYRALWVLVASNGSAGDLSLQFTLPADGARLLATGTYVETSATLGPVYLITTSDTALSDATTVYGATVVLQAATANSAVTNKARVIASGWGVSNV